MVERYQARALADASALAVESREQFVDGGCRLTVTVQVGSAGSQAAVSDALDG
ncbi:MAG: hypothetical protein ACON36_00690 [Ilumatobacteraceae bacterium]